MRVVSIFRKDKQIKMMFLTRKIKMVKQKLKIIMKNYLQLMTYIY